MPYIDGKRVSNDEWSKQKGDLTQLHTSERGVNPGEDVVLADANAEQGDDDSEQEAGEKLVIGTQVVDAPADNEADNVSVAGSELSGGIPGEPSEDSEVADDSDGKGSGSASEAAADFVEDRKSKTSKRKGAKA